MHYYKKNIGDYAKKTGRLTLLQHGAYTLLIDACYDRERFPTLDEAIEWTWALTPDEVAAVEFVLGRFFTLEDGRYIQARIQEEIQEYHGKAIKNKEIAIEREAKKREQSTTRARSVHETAPNQEPRTNNHKPKDKNIAPPEGVDSNVWNDFVAHRKSKKASLSATALKGIESEARKANISLQAALELCIMRGWTGFKAEWVEEKKTATDKNRAVLSGLTRGLMGNGHANLLTN